MPYFDFNATAPLHPAAREAWLDATARAWQNPSGLYAEAAAARHILDDCRERLATLIGCVPDRIVFTGGATAANNALARHVGGTSADTATAVMSAIEHPCVAEAFAAAMPGRVAALPVDRHGVVSLSAVEEVLGSRRPPGGIAVVSVLAASNESGTIQPWQEIASLCRRHGVPFHTDAAQWLGKMPGRDLGACDWVTGSGHKFGGPKGVGFIVQPELETAFHGDRGGPQEGGRHAGTEDVASIAAMVSVLEIRERTGDEQRHGLAAARDAAARRLQELVPAAVVIGAGAPRLWNTLAVLIPGADGKKIVARLSRTGIQASTGSACSAGAGATARVLTAIGTAAGGPQPADRNGMVRLSGGWGTTPEEWLDAVEGIAAACGEGSSLPRVSFSRPA